MWRRLENGEYTHILLGPEQATHHRFLRILRSARFNQGLAFIAVDELHMVFQWRDFRVAYPDIHRLRALVPYDTSYSLVSVYCYSEQRSRRVCGAQGWFSAHREIHWWTAAHSNKRRSAGYLYHRTT